MTTTSTDRFDHSGAATPTADGPGPRHARSPASRARWWQGALAGIVSGGVGLAAAEVVVGVFDSFTSPVISVGDKAIDLVPVPLKTFAIRTFGTNDKATLLIGIATTIVIFAALVGIAGARRRLLGVAGLVAFGLLGAAAATTGRTGTATDALPSLLAAVVGTVALLLLLGLAERDRRVRATMPPVDTAPSAGPTPTSPAAPAGSTALTTAIAPAGSTAPATPAAPLTRRTFLLGTGALAATAAAAGSIGRALQSSAGAVASRARSIVARAKTPLPPPSPAISAPALADVTPFFTPNKDFYRIDTALVVPRIDVADWKLTVHGMVDRKRTYTYDQLLARDLVERDITLTCVSNEVGGILMGTARWVGVPLRELLDEAGADPKATQVVGRSVDGWTSGFPTATVHDGHEPLVALAMNGEALPFRHGFPARLIVPGLYGYVSATKWLTEIEMTTLDAFDAYWVPRGYAKEAPIKLASRIDVHRGLATVPAGPAAIAGVAWAQTVGISRVELSIDGGPWIDATLADAASKDTWRQWSYTWNATSGRHEIVVRATDANGTLQREQRRAPLPNGATGWHSIIVFVA